MIRALQRMLYAESLAGPPGLAAPSGGHTLAQAGSSAVHPLSGRLTASDCKEA
eukprot:gene21379-8144_t